MMVSVEVGGIGPTVIVGSVTGTEVLEVIVGSGISVPVDDLPGSSLKASIVP